MEIRSTRGIEQDVVYGEGGDDTLGGNVGDDLLIGGNETGCINVSHGDAMFGDAGNDTL